MKFKYLFFIICIFILLLCWFYIPIREKKDWEEEIKGEIAAFNALPLSYSLEDAIHDGYYYEDKTAENTPVSMIQFLCYVDDHAKVNFKIVSKSDSTLRLTNIIYRRKKFTVLKYYIGTEKRGYERKEYNYLIVLEDKNQQTYSYYLTNDRKLYQSVKEDPRMNINIEKQNIYYLFSRSYALKE